jgi:DNA-binding winged helix-turn-helix (wHTH) protein
MTTGRFGRFELDPKRGELRKDGEIIPLPPQPFKVLLSLAMRSGETVTRGEIRQESGAATRSSTSIRRSISASARFARRWTMTPARPDTSRRCRAGDIDFFRL